MILKIVKYPEPVLQQPGEPVTEFDTELRKFVADMFETMYASQGIGLAAQQVGVAKRITVIDLSRAKTPRRSSSSSTPKSFVAKASSTKKKAASAFLRFARRFSARPRSASAPRTHTASGSRWMAKSCSPAPFSMRSTTSMACSLSSA